METTFKRAHGVTYIEKTPVAELDYGVDWALWLETGDTLTASAWQAEDGLTLAQPVFNDTSTAVKISGGLDGETYMVVNAALRGAEGVPLESTVRGENPGKD